MVLYSRTNIERTIFPHFRPSVWPDLETALSTGVARADAPQVRHVESSYLMGHNSRQNLNAFLPSRLCALWKTVCARSNRADALHLRHVLSSYLIGVSAQHWMVFVPRYGSAVRRDQHNGVYTAARADSPGHSHV